MFILLETILTHIDAYTKVPPEVVALERIVRPYGVHVFRHQIAEVERLILRSALHALAVKAWRNQTPYFF